MFNPEEFSTLKKKILDIKGKRDYIILYQKQEVLTKNEQEQEMNYATEARIVIQQIAQKTQQKLEQRFSQLITNALQVVFPDDGLEFVLKFVPKRGKTEANIKWLENGLECTAVGGGIRDVSSYSARVAFWSLSKNSRGIFFSDEPCKFINSPESLENFSELLQMLGERLKIQNIIIASEGKDIKGDREYRIIKGEAQLIS